jgi:hypothetical protein
LSDVTDMLDSSVEGENANDLAFNDQLANVQTRHVGCRKTGRLIVADENACAGAAGFAAFATQPHRTAVAVAALRTSGADWALQSALAPQALGASLAAVALWPHRAAQTLWAAITSEPRFAAVSLRTLRSYNRADNLFTAIREPLHQASDSINRRADDRPAGQPVATVSASVTALALMAGISARP